MSRRQMRRRRYTLIQQYERRASARCNYCVGLSAPEGRALAEWIVGFRRFLKVPQTGIGRRT